jgi:transcriptional regulator with XRE-family HTH domain
MTITEFGKRLRILRIERGEILMTMATTLGVTPSYLSAVENGKREVPLDWPRKIAQHYALSAADFEELVSFAELSKTTVRLNLGKAGQPQRSAALAFARSFDEMDDSTAKKIADFLGRSGGEEDD